MAATLVFDIQVANMANAIAAIAASLNPGEWTKDISAEENLKTFGRYVTRFQRWISVCGMNAFSVQQKWDLFIAMGGQDLEDLILHQARGVTCEIAQVIAAVGPPVVVAVTAVNPTPWEAGLELCRNAISRYTNQIMARNKLLSNMPASDFDDCRKWGQEILEQAKRCLWDKYGF